MPSPALEGAVPWAAAPGRWTGPRQAQAVLGLQSAEAVLVGHPSGHAQPAGGRAGAPGRAPFWAGDARGWGSDKARKLGSWGEEREVSTMRSGLGSQVNPAASGAILVKPLSLSGPQFLPL